MKLKYFTFVFIILFLINCGGSDTSNEEESSKNNMTTSIGGIIQLGYIKGANVTISSLNGYIFQDNLITDENGKYFPDKEKIRKAIDNYNPSMKFLLITSNGGVDTDPNDDGIIDNNETTEVKGEVKAIVSIEDFFSDKDYTVNLITTAIADIVGDNTNISEEQIIKIAKEIGVEDIDDDGNITMADLVYYNMVDNESRAEAYLRTNHLEQIHDNDIEGIQNFITELKMNQSLIMPIITFSSNSLNVKFKPLNSLNHIEYGIKSDLYDFTYMTYNNESINLPSNSVLYFKECTSNNECYKVQKVLYDGTNYYLDYLAYEEPQELFSNKTELESLKNTVDTKKTNLSELKQELNILETELQDIDTKVYESL